MGKDNGNIRYVQLVVNKNSVESVILDDDEGVKPSHQLSESLSWMRRSISDGFIQFLKTTFSPEDSAGVVCTDDDYKDIIQKGNHLLELMKNINRRKLPRDSNSLPDFKTVDRNSRDYYHVSEMHKPAPRRVKFQSRAKQKYQYSKLNSWSPTISSDESSVDDISIDNQALCKCERNSRRNDRNSNKSFFYPGKSCTIQNIGEIGPQENSNYSDVSDHNGNLENMTKKLTMGSAECKNEEYSLEKIGSVHRRKTRGNLIWDSETNTFLDVEKFGFVLENHIKKKTVPLPNPELKSGGLL